MNKNKRVGRPTIYESDEERKCAKLICSRIHYFRKRLATGLEDTDRVNFQGKLEELEQELQTLRGGSTSKEPTLRQRMDDLESRIEALERR
jgi:predicted  nucleic acid-binding Zn-ribbon protein